MKRLANSQAGFSMIELMIVVALTALGLVTLLKMQAQTLQAVGSSRTIAEAANLGNHLLESLKLEAVEWSMDGTLMIAQTARFPHLSQAGSPNPGSGSGWLRTMLPDTTEKLVGPLGNDALLDTGLLTQFPWDRNRRFCVQYRLTWLLADWLMRADVRVLWVRDNSRVGLYDECPDDMENDPANVGFVSIGGAIMRNMFIK
jgi:prepilin-type N-terminal cleavage/methylation domain-containing protein